MFKQTKKYISEHFMQAHELEGPHPEQTTQEAKKHTSNQSEAGTQIQGPILQTKQAHQGTNHQGLTPGPTCQPTRGMQSLGGSPRVGRTQMCSCPGAL
jgi:hypothetical protein